MAGRQEDGSLAVGLKASEMPNVDAVLEQLLPEPDGFGGKFPWQVTWRRTKRKEREAAGKQAPIVEGAATCASPLPTC